MSRTFVLLGGTCHPEFVRVADYLETDWRQVFVEERPDNPALAEELARADAVLSMAWGSDMLSAPRLRLLQLPGAGTDLVDLDAVPETAAVCNVYEHEIGIAEYLVCAMLMWVTGIQTMDRNLRRDDWSDSLYAGGPPHGELMGKTVGIVGHGRIGRELARRLKPFGLRVIARTRSPGKTDTNLDGIGPMTDLETLLAESDFVVLSLPLNAETEGLFDAALLRRMKPSAVLVNVARGPLVDEDALYQACREGWIAGAVIDTWYAYPEKGSRIRRPSKHPFHELGNVIMTPHSSGWSTGMLSRRCRTIARNLDRLARGEPLVNVVRPARG